MKNNTKRNWGLNRSNPMLSFTIAEDEYLKLEKIAIICGATLAQVARAIYRLGNKQLPEDVARDEHILKFLPILVAGKDVTEKRA